MLIAAGAAVVADWWAVGTSRRSAEIVLKPLAMMTLVGVAAVAGPDLAGAR